MPIQANKNEIQIHYQIKINQSQFIGININYELI